MFGMNPAQLEGTIRQFLPFFSGIALALGWTWFDGVASAILMALGPVMGLASLIWSLVSKKQANIVAAAAALRDANSVPIVERIALAPTVAGHDVEAATPHLPNVAVVPR